MKKFKIVLESGEQFEVEADVMTSYGPAVSFSKITNQAVPLNEWAPVDNHEQVGIFNRVLYAVAVSGVI